MIDKTRIKPKKWAYLAGLIDGDGSISIRDGGKKGYQLTTSVWSTCRPLMKWLVRSFGGQFRKLPTKGNRKQKYCWYTYCKNVVEQVTPYLILKADQGRLAQRYYIIGSERNPELRNELMTDLQNANRFFVPVVNTPIPESLCIPTKADFAYLAGLFDAEGSFSIHKRNLSGNGQYTSLARISNTDQRIFDWLRSRFGGGFSITPRKTRDEGCWCLTGKKDREKMMLATLPYLVVKKERASILLEWMRSNHTFSSDKKEEFFQQMAILNHRGLTPEANTSRLPNREGKIESDLHGDVQRKQPVMVCF